MGRRRSSLIPSGRVDLPYERRAANGGIPWPGRLRFVQNDNRGGFGALGGGVWRWEGAVEVSVRLRALGSAALRTGLGYARDDRWGGREGRQRLAGRVGRGVENGQRRDPSLALRMT